MQVDKGRVVGEAVTRIMRVADGEGLLLQPHKKDRSLYIIRCGEVMNVFEMGFSRQRFVVSEGKLKKLLKTLCKREFPRSKKVWIYTLTAEKVVKVMANWS